MIRREEARLRRVFRRLLLVSIAAPGGFYACSSAPVRSSPSSQDAGRDAANEAQDAGRDATSSDDSSLGEDGATPTASDTGTPPADAEPEGGPVNAGPDAGQDATVTRTCDSTAAYLTDASYVQDDASFYVDDAGDVVQVPLHCYSFVDLPCGLPATETTSGCFLYLNECAQIWDGSFYSCQVWGAQCDDGSVNDPPDAQATIAFSLCSGVGRRPAGLEPPRAAKGGSALGSYFAHAAHLEAASVDAFLALRDELIAFEAPPALARMAARSARDETRHARLVGRLARRFGGAPAKVRVRPRGARSFEAMARENVVEGCVRETFGAIVATWQADHAADSEVRTAMQAIAADETRHAALAWAVDRWAATRLDHEARERLRDARRDAVGALRREVSGGAESAMIAAAGLPSRAQSLALIARMTEALWVA